MTICALFFPKFCLSEFSTLKEHRQDSYLIHGINFYICSLWNSTFLGNSTNCLSPITANNVMNVIFTALSSQKYCLPSRRSSSKTVLFVRKSSMPLLHWWTTHITMFFRLIKEVMGHYECFSDVYTKFYHCSLLRPI